MQKPEFVGVHKEKRHSVWDFRQFIIYKMLVAGAVNSMGSGRVVLVISSERALYYAALFMCLQGCKLVG